MLILGILLFSILVTGASFVIFRKYEGLEKTELCTYVVLIAWGSLLLGFLLAQIA